MQSPLVPRPEARLGNRTLRRCIGQDNETLQFGNAINDPGSFSYT
jgi:hypothetical protein